MSSYDKMIEITKLIMFSDDKIIEMFSEEDQQLVMSSYDILIKTTTTASRRPV